MVRILVTTWGQRPPFLRQEPTSSTDLEWSTDSSSPSFDTNTSSPIINTRGIPNPNPRILPPENPSPPETRSMEHQRLAHLRYPYPPLQQKLETVRVRRGSRKRAREDFKIGQQSVLAASATEEDSVAERLSAMEEALNMTAFIQERFNPHVSICLACFEAEHQTMLEILKNHFSQQPPKDPPV